VRIFLWLCTLVAMVVINLAVAGASTKSTSPSPNIVCVSPSPCVLGQNTGTGDGVEGTSTKLFGVLGVTVFPSSSGNSRAGVYGKDDGTGGFNAGVRATSQKGYGVFATSGNIGIDASSTGGGGVGVLGIGPSIGVWGTSMNANTKAICVFGNGTSVGVHGENTRAGGTAVEAQSLVGNGLIFQGIGAAGNLVTIADNGDFTTGGNIFTTGSVLSSAEVRGACFGCGAGIGLSAASDGTAGVQTTAATPTTLAIEAFGGGGTIIDAQNLASTAVFDLDDSGNVTIAGKLFTSGTCSIGCAPPHHAGKHVVSYAPQESQPTMEDFGEGLLVDGRAFIHLDAAYTSVIQSGANYLVFITPEGDSRGLYVTQKSPSGFAVRENGGGHATIAFSYRIVAKPFGDASPRLPMLTTTASHRPQQRVPAHPKTD
jgi:hypothetical protein